MRVLLFMHSCTHIYWVPVTTPPPLVAGLAACLCLCVFCCRCPAGVASSFVIGNTWVCYYKSTAHGFHGRFRERERSRGNLAPYCSSWAMIIAPYLLRYNIPSTALACIHARQPYCLTH